MRAFLVAAALLLFIAPAAAEERITFFNSNVVVHKDGALDVIETIELVSEGREIRRGILRDFPTDYKDRRGLAVKVGFKVENVKRDGHDEPYAVESIARGKRVRIGDRDVFIGSGRHVYEISYRTTRQLGFFEDFDELYWNVTGNSWTFPIERASVDISLPPEAVIRQSAAYTGGFGASGRDFSILNAKGNFFSAKTTRRLAAGEGITVAVAWQKGVIASSPDSQRILWMLADNADLLALLLSLIAVAAYYFYAWSKVGRDPSRGQTIPLFKPPKDLGPAATRYVWRQGFDDRTFAAALVGLAAQGWLKIKEEGGEFSVTKTARFGSVETKPESEVYAALGGGTLVLAKSNREKVLSMKEALENSLDKAYFGAMFKRNRVWFWFGVGLTVACLLLSALFMPDGERDQVLSFIAFVPVFACLVLVKLWANIKTIKQSSSMIFLPFLLVFVAPFFVAVANDGSTSMIAYFIVVIVLACMNVLFLNLLYAPTKAGRWVMDEIEGFRMFLATTEEERLNLLNPPEKTPQLFERFLPFAIALDCENEWGKKFESVLAAAAATNGYTSPGWYSGTSWSSSNVGNFTTALGSSLISNVISASASSSSGSGGGGFSGGGGGGGGGSGW
jgi:uncharacterized membrane protein YgcG